MSNLPSNLNKAYGHKVDQFLVPLKDGYGLLENPAKCNV